MRRAWISMVAALLPALAAAHLHGTESFTASQTDGAAASDSNAAAPPKALPAEAELKLKEVLDAAKKVVTKRFAQTMKEEVDVISRTCNLHGESVKSLEAAASSAADRSAAAAVTQMEKSCRQWAAGFEKAQLLEQFTQMLANMDAIADNNDDFNRANPTDDPEWKSALEKTLTTEQGALLKKARAEYKSAVETEVGGLLKNMLTGFRSQWLRSLDVQTDEIELATNLPGEQRKELAALAKSVADQTADSWRTEALESLAKLTPRERQTIVKSGRYFVALKPDQLPLNTMAWKDGVAGILGADRVQQWKDFQEKREARRSEILSRLAVCELDRTVGFTSSQRNALRPVLERRIKKDRQESEENGNSVSTNYNAYELVAAAAKIDPKEIQPLLDQRQWKRWREVCGAESKAEAPGFDRQNPPEDEPPPIAGRPEDAEYMDEAVSTLGSRDVFNAHDSLVSRLTLQAERIARAAALAPAAEECLFTAAKGAAEAILSQHEIEWEQNARASLADTEPGRATLTIARASRNFNAEWLDPTNAMTAPIWQKAFATLLTPEQKAAWTSAEQEQRDYQAATHIDSILVSLEESSPLAPEQESKLKPLLVKAIDDYGPDLNQFFGGSENWCTQPMSRLVPLALIPEPDRKQILTETQRDHLEKTTDFQYATNYLRMIKQNHEQRLKQQALESEKTVK